MTYDEKATSTEHSSFSCEKATTVAARKRSLFSQSLWWLKLVQVRARFLIIVVVSAAIVSQWAKVQSLWDRWVWNTTSVTAISSVSGAHEFFCPMDPGVLSVWPAICPICNMDLVPRRRTEAQILPEGVVARMQLTPYRIQLAGIRTAVVEPKDLQYRMSFSGILENFAPEEEDKTLIGFDAFPSGSDLELFHELRSATVSLRGVANRETAGTVYSNMTEAGDVGQRMTVRIVLDDPAAFPSGSAVTATIIVTAGEVLACDQLSPLLDSDNRILCVPESAIVDRGPEQLVYVESMPGMFDGVAVKVGRRMGSYFPVLSGLQPGQRVASSGAFLIDAETRLNPSLAAGYFGANPSALTSTSATSPLAPVRKMAEKGDGRHLSDDDQRMVDQQKICPVTDLLLDSMGGPIPVMIGDRKVFICCAGCERRLRDEPEKYLAKIPKGK